MDLTSLLQPLSLSFSSPYYFKNQPSSGSLASEAETGAERHMEEANVHFVQCPLEWRFAQGCSFTKGDVKMVPAGSSSPAAPTGLAAKLPLQGDKE